jgi:ATP-dependent DNA ligase
MSTRNGRLRYFGNSGTGFSEKGLKETIDRLKPLFIDESPVENPPNIPEKSNGFNQGWSVKWRSRNGPRMSNCARQLFRDGVMIKTPRKKCYDWRAQNVLIIAAL